MTNYIPITNVLARIPQSLFEDSNESDFIDWFMDGLKELPQVIQYQPKIEMFEIINSKVILPKYVKQINSIYYQLDNITEEETSELVCEPTDLNPDICKPTITYQMFLNSIYYKNKLSLLKYIGQDKSLLCKTCPNLSCAETETFVITPEKIMYLSLKEGWICINYDAPVCAEDGVILIPDNQDLINFLIVYSIAKHWENRKFLKEEQANNFHQEYLQKAEIALRKARGGHFLRNINAENVVDIQSSLQRIIKLPQLYRNEQHV